MIVSPVHRPPLGEQLLAQVRALIVRGELAPGTQITGPAVCALPEATLAVPAGWSGTVDDEGTVILDRRR
jgi:N-methylhydantoinase A/oxoprolinase/acetone carboxylase beta subunit